MAPRIERNRENQTGRIFAFLQFKNKDLVCSPHFSSGVISSMLVDLHKVYRNWIIATELIFLRSKYKKRALEMTFSISFLNTL